MTDSGYWMKQVVILGQSLSLARRQYAKNPNSVDLELHETMFRDAVRNYTNPFGVEK